MNRSHRILNAATESFVQCGYAASNMDDIARKAGVPKPFLYVYFGSKHGLFRQVMERACEVTDRHLAAALAIQPVRPLADEVLALTSGVIQFADTYPLTFRLVFSAPCGTHGLEQAQLARGAVMATIATRLDAVWSQSEKTLDAASFGVLTSAIALVELSASDLMPCQDRVARAFDLAMGWIEGCVAGEPSRI